MKRSKDTPPAAPSSSPLLDPEARIIMAAVALHGMLAGKTALPTPVSEFSQDERRADAATRLAKDAWAVADAMIAEGSK